MSRFVALSTRSGVVIGFLLAASHDAALNDKAIVIGFDDDRDRAAAHHHSEHAGRDFEGRLGLRGSRGFAPQTADPMIATVLLGSRARAHARGGHGRIAPPGNHRAHSRQMVGRSPGFAGAYVDVALS